MTALEEWEEIRYGEHDHDSLCDAADAAMAELLAQVDHMDDLLTEAEKTIEAMKCCGNCRHIEVEKHDSGSSYMVHTDFSLQCDGYFPSQDWCESSGWVKDEFPVTDFDHHCHFTPSHWQPRGEAT